MKNFSEETAPQPPEPRGEQTPEPADQKRLEEESGETMLDETIPEEMADEDEESVEWDGSEAELVADEDAPEYEERQTGIKLKYILTSKEIFYALLKSRYTVSRIVSSTVACVLCAIMAVAFVTVSADKNGQPGVISVLCLILLVAIIILPLLHLISQSKQLADGKEIRMKIYPDHICMGAKEGEWEISLDGTSERISFRDLIILYTTRNNLVILPVRCVEPGVLPEVQAMIFAGTQPKH